MTPAKPPPASKPKQHAGKSPLTGLKKQPDGGLAQGSDLLFAGTGSEPGKEYESILTDPKSNPSNGSQDTPITKAAAKQPAAAKEKSSIFGTGGKVPASAIEPSGFCISTGEDNEVSRAKKTAEDKQPDPKKPPKGIQPSPHPPAQK